MFEELQKALSGLSKSQEMLMKGQEQRFIMWTAEMCMRYNKKPEEVVGIVEKILKHMKKQPKGL